MSIYINVSFMREDNINIDGISRCLFLPVLGPKSSLRVSKSYACYMFHPH